MKEALNDYAFSGRPKINVFAERSGGTPKGAGCGIISF
jgi:hypothetical protein